MPENVNTSALSIGDFESIEADDNRQTMIKVDHVSMIFNMASEQLNSLKEYAIKIARRELFFEGFTALDDISFEVKKGDVFGIIGTNGSGKSTLLKIIAGVLEPTEGACEINGNIAPLIELGAGFDTELSARENIYLNGALLGYSKKFIDDHFDEIVEFAEIEKFLDMPLKNYSSGMVARIAFAIATVIVPEILVVDEVLSVGDFMFQKKCEDRINELIEKYGVTVLIVSHSNAQIERMCNKAIWIEKGHTRMMGDAATVCRVYGGLGGRTGSPEAEQRVFEALRNAGGADQLDNLYMMVAGENAASTNAKLVLRGWRNTESETVVIANGTSHINAAISNALAAAYDAPVLSTKPDALPDAVERILYDVKPTTIITVDCGAWATKAFSQLESLPWKPSIIAFNNDGDIYELSWRIFEFGQERNLWKDDLALVHFNDNLETLAIAPFLYEQACPLIIMTESDHNNRKDDLIDRLSSAKRETIYIIGSAISKETESHIQQGGQQTLRLAGNSASENCLRICEFVFDHPRPHDLSAKRELCVASLSLTQWPELLSCGGYAGKQRTALLLEDTSDLDSIQSSLDFVRARQRAISSITSIGGSTGLSELDLALLSYELLPHKENDCGQEDSTPTK